MIKSAIHKSIFIISDIEGSSGCFDYESSAFKNKKWPGACLAMTKDVNSIVNALFSHGANNITVKDFHRTGYNLLPEYIDPGAKIISGYKRGPVPGFGHPGDATALMMTGMHASSGTTGFLSHTMTSRIEKLEVNGKLMSEAELFSASLEPYNIYPVFFSGCPVACKEAEKNIKNIQTYAIDKFPTGKKFDSESWRRGLTGAAVKSMGNFSAKPHLIRGPQNAVVSMRDGADAAGKLASRWGFKWNGNRIYIYSDNIESLYFRLIQLCYLTPFIEKILPFGLFLYNIYGRYGRHWVRKRV